MRQDKYKQNVINILTRLRSVIDVDSDAELARVLGVSPNSLSNWKRRNTFDSERLFTFCADNSISIDWLITGEGSYKTNEKVYMHIVSDQIKKYGSKSDQDLESQTIPLYDIHAAAGLSEVFNSKKSVPIDHIRIPNAPKCDGAIFATGDSMYPLIKSGDLVMFKQVPNDISNIFFGNMYVLSIAMNGDDLITIKWVQKSELGDDYVKLVSENRYHEPKDVRLDQITAMAIIKIHTRFYTMS